MLNLKERLQQLKKDLRILQERKAKYAGEPPLSLVHQIDDYQKAIVLTRQAITAEISQDALETALKPLVLSLRIEADLKNVEQAISNLQTLLTGEMLSNALKPLLEQQAALEAKLNSPNLSNQTTIHGDIIDNQAGRDIITGDNTTVNHIINVYQQQGGQQDDLPTLYHQINSYLHWVLDQHGTIELRGIKREGKQVVQLDLETVYVPLAATSYGYSSRKLELDQILSLANRLIVTGGPGCGKTTVLLHLAWILGKALQNNAPTLAEDKLGLKLPEPNPKLPNMFLGIPLPIFVPLSAYALHLRNLPPHTPAAEKTLATFITRYLIERQSSFDLPPDFFQHLLQQGQAVILLLDGLDEVPNETERTQVREAIEDLVTSRDEMRVVVTCRTAAYRDQTALGKGFEEIKVLPLTKQYLTNLVKHAYAAIYKVDKQARQEKSEELLQAIAHLEAERQQRFGKDTPLLIDSPLLVRMLLVVHYSERRLPDQRAELYLKATDAMLLPEYGPDIKVANRIGGLVGGSREIHRELVQHIAFAMHQQGEEQGREISEGDLRQILKEHPTYVNLMDDFIALTRLRGTLMEERLGTYRFIHLAFQEFMVARYLASEMQAKGGIEAIATFLESGPILDSWWREVVLLVAGYFSATAPRTAEHFLQRLGSLDKNATQRNQTLSTEIQLVAVELSWVAVNEWPNLPSSLKTAIGERLSTVFKDKDLFSQVPVRRRVDVGDTIGKVGDPRPGVNTLPPLLTALIEGEFLYGKDNQPMTLPLFRAAVYPVTNAQYAYFMNDGGYATKKWWSEAGWQWRRGKPRYEWQKMEQPDRWNDAKFNNPNQPVVGVTYYEAEAFCNWLSANFEGTYRLPTEEEWERLARGQDGRLYPWGDKWQEGLANTDKSGIGRSSAVGLFPDGISPTGVYDCAGNVWEWCASWYDRSAIRYRVMRGGSWNDNDHYARSVVRNRYYPSNSYNNDGFRVIFPI